MGNAVRRHEGRYTFGKPDAQRKGRTPVFVDGAPKPVAYVWNTGSGRQPWRSDALAHDAAARWEGAERVVDLVDKREEREHTSVHTA